MNFLKKCLPKECAVKYAQNLVEKMLLNHKIFSPSESLIGVSNIVIIKKMKMVYSCVPFMRTDVLTGRNIRVIYPNTSDFILAKNHMSVQFVENNLQNQVVTKTI